MNSILIVDDQDVVRKEIINVLDKQIKLFDRIYEGSNGEEALSIIKEHNPDIILLDIMMPICTGFELLEKLVSLNIVSNVIIISSHTVFSFAQRALEFNVSKYITKPLKKDELEKAIIDILESKSKKAKEKGIIDNYRNKAYSFRLFEFLRGNDVYVNINELANDIGLVSIKKFFFTLVLFSVDVNRHQQIIKIISQSSLENFLIFENPSGEILIIISHDNEVVENLEFAITYIATKAQSINCGISNNIKEISALSEAYVQAKMASNIAREDKNFCVYYSNIVTKNSTIISKKDCDDFISLLQKLDKKNVLVFLDALFLNIVQKPIDISNVKKSIYSFTNYIDIYFFEITGKYFMSEELKVSIDMTNSIMETKLILKKHYSQLVDEIKIYKEKDNTDLGYVITKILLEINEKYMNDISLSDLSNKYNVNYAYLSNLFGKKVGVSFTDYLLNIRLEKSREMLTSTNKKVVTIANETGFASSAYFCKIFKKTYNISPIEYRNSY